MHQHRERDRQDSDHQHPNHEQHHVQQTLIASGQTCETIGDLHGLSSLDVSAALVFFFTPTSSGHLRSNSSTYFWRVSPTTWLTFAIFAPETQRCSVVASAVDKFCASCVVGTMPLTRTCVRSTSSSSMS